MTAPPELSVVLPVFNEIENLDELRQCLAVPAHLSAQLDHRRGEADGFASDKALRNFDRVSVQVRELLNPAIGERTPGI